LIRIFGDQYGDYQKRVGKWFPRLAKHGSAARGVASDE
jgi:hypothetical protein